MKGVKINNYIDNRIVLSSRKLKNQVQALIQSNRPRPLVIRHLNYYEQELDPAANTEQKDAIKAIESKSNKKPRKKSKIIPNTNEANHQSNQKSGRKEHPKKISGNKNIQIKKKSQQSSPSRVSDNRLNSTQKKPRSLSKNNEGLGKRSKSAILKNNKSPVNVIVEQQKKKAHESMKLNLNIKKEPETTRKKKSKKDKKGAPASSKTRELKKNLSSLNISEKKKKSEKEETKTVRPPSKSIISSSAQSKPVSAREHKKKETNMVKNLFGPVEPKVEQGKQLITLQQLLSLQKKDFKAKSAILKLEDAINTKGSRKKLSEKLEMLAQKLKQLDSNESQQEQSENEQKHSGIQEEEQSQSRVKQFMPIQESTVVKQEKQRDFKNQFTNPQIANKLPKYPLISSEDSEQQYIEVEEEMFAEQNKNQQAANKQIESKRENYIKDPDSKREKLERQHGTYQREEEQNPLIGRKNYGDPYMELVDYDSINSVKSNQEDKRSEINQLKKFQEQSDLMMKRIKQLENKKKSEEPQPVKAPQLQNPPINTPLKPPNPASPRALQINNYAFQKYPTIESSKSPKFNSQQIIEVIKLKQRLSSNRHEKLSELVNVMFDKKIVSPKTYSIQIQSLREQQAQNNQILDSYKKHAEELAQLLSEIKKEKEEISSIDEMIRSEKWNEAMTVIKQNQKIVSSEESKKKHAPLDKITLPQHKKQQLQQQNEEAVYYSGEDSELSQTGIKLIQIENDDDHKQPPEPKNNTIKIDESNNKPEKRQRGFDSNLFFIKEYCIALCEYVRDNHKNSFRKRIGEPMAYDMEKLLRSFRENRNGTIPVLSNSLSEDLAYHDCDFHVKSQPISVQVFNQFNKQYPSIKYYHKEESQDAMLEGIFLKSIYDALNQSIMIQKPGSVNGKALPWANNSKHLKNLKNSLKNSSEQKLRNQQSEDLIFGISIARIIQWGSCLCGFIPDTVQLQNTEIDEEYINHIRETRTALLLQKMLVDEQASMYRTELQETEVKICMSQIIFDELAKQLAQEMRKIVLRATLRGVDY